jgi:hypothetical protein
MIHMEVDRMSNMEQVILSKKYFQVSFTMMENIIAQCPDELWNEKKGGYVFWQQIFHALTGVNFWMRLNNEQFVEPFSERKLYPELEQEPESHLSRSELLEYKEQVKSIANDFFDGRDDHWLYQGSAAYNKVKNIEIIYMQIRHLQYHVGHCNCILRENGYQAVEWLEYFGQE